VTVLAHPWQIPLDELAVRTDNPLRRAQCDVIVERPYFFGVEITMFDDRMPGSAPILGNGSRRAWEYTKNCVHADRYRPTLLVDAEVTI
jgi:hypothetical protein